MLQIRYDEQRFIITVVSVAVIVIFAVAVRFTITIAFTVAVDVAVAADVAIADVNRDGDPDIGTATSRSEWQLCVLRNSSF